MPTVRHILETSLYVDDLDQAEGFYYRVFGCRTKLGDDRMRALGIAEGQILLLFERDKSSGGEDTPRGHIPGHNGAGSLHLALAIPAEEVESWRSHLADQNIQVISRVRPEQGGESLYFRDPDDNLIELATPAIWNV